MYLPWRKQCNSKQVPSLNQKIPTYNQFGNANIFQVYGKEKLEQSTHYNATYFQSSILHNIEGNNFETKALENNCQFAPSNSFLSIDLNKDGKQDILSVGNQYAVEVETGRYDAHIGNVLLNENGKLLNKRNTGFFIDTDARCIKSITINKQTYIIVSSNKDKLRFSL